MKHYIILVICFFLVLSCLSEVEIGFDESGIGRDKTDTSEFGKEDGSIDAGSTSLMDGTTDAGSTSMADDSIDADSISMADGSTDADSISMADGGTDADSISMADGSTDADASSTTDAGISPVAMTSCVSVAHIGDSLTYYTQTSLMDAYTSIGASVEINAYGGRAVLQKVAQDPMTGKEAAISIRSSGFNGCWVVALGTNDTANIAAGAWYTRAKAIDEMMTAVDPTGTIPVMWVNTHTTRTSGYYSDNNMKLWNEALEEALERWPNLVIYDWATLAETEVAPYSDGIHHTSAGYEVRNTAIANALAQFFPAL